ncbi:uncharacterized protein RJT20DRAFT_59303 [Scheffersomyces xylosifermentans]|uniref:uncharacterized protein n=1 Tax=Scheffersomyces xylosifermentans TaxID=1304137 RepID=UPI00315DE4F2
MPKYYCDYCKSYLTHDTMSVRKSHLMGRNHIKYYCSYYEEQAKKTGIWNPEELAYEVTFNELDRNAPGSKAVVKKKNNDYLLDVTYKNEDQQTKDSDKDEAKKEGEDEEENFSLPPPPNLAGFPNPPPSVLCNTVEYQKAILKYTQ